jgi:hypothetical protein
MLKFTDTIDAKAREDGRKAFVTQSIARGRNYADSIAIWDVAIHAADEAMNRLTNACSILPSAHDRMQATITALEFLMAGGMALHGGMKERGMAVDIGETGDD